MGASQVDVLTEYAKQLIRTKARQLTRRAGFSPSDHDDLEQELAMHLIRRAHHFDPARASLNTFVARVVDSCVRTILRDRYRLKRVPEQFACSLEQARETEDGASTSLRDLITAAHLPGRAHSAAEDDVARADFVEAVRRAIASLPVDLREVCERLADGNVASVARELGISRRQVRNAIGHIRQHFEDGGLADF